MAARRQRGEPLTAAEEAEVRALFERRLLELFLDGLDVRLSLACSLPLILSLSASSLLPGQVPYRSCIHRHYQAEEFTDRDRR